MSKSKHRKREKRVLRLVEDALNRAIIDGYRPYNPADPDVPDSACTETERRIGLPSGFIADAISAGKITQNLSLYKSEDPHQGLIDALRGAGIEITSDDKARRYLRRLVDENKQLKKTITRIDREQLTMEEVRTKVYGLPSLVPVVPNWVISSHKKAGTPGIPMTLWSDWHYGEVVEAGAMSGKNAFNLKIADKRIETLVDRIIDITIRHQVNPQYSGIIVCFGGDMFSGDGLHEELTDTNEAKTIGLFMRLQGRLIWALERLADTHGRVYVPCDFGNHGRNTVEHRYKLRAETNYEFLLYNQLEQYFRNNPRYADKVTFNISQGAGVHFTVGGHRYYLTHGDSLGVKGGDGIIGAIGPIKRGSIKTSASEESIGHGYDTILMGHYHQYITLQGIIVNGTLKGWCEFARNAMRAPYSRPTQALWFNHPVYGPNPLHRVVLDNRSNSPRTPPKHDDFPTTPRNKRRTNDPKLKLVA